MSAQTKTHSDAFSKFVGYSVVIHLIVFFAFTIQSVFAPTPDIDFSSAVKVDLVALPDKAEPAPALEPQPESPQETAKETPQKEEPIKPAPAKEKPELKKKVADKDAIKIDKTKSKEKAAFEKLKQMSALEKIQKDLEKSKSASKKPIKGNILADGNSLRGLAKLEYDEYADSVQTHIMQSWSLPQYLRGKGLTTHVRVRFDQSGFVLSKEIIKSSGNPTYDEVVLAAVQKSSPVPPPPEQFVRISTYQGLVFRFSE